ncbi:MAG: DNA adenine methylase [Fusobacteriaceae bacterium]|jgi:DNA adenine methylase|nr:DNA adenine methylase [Fusobacteriaceae bacterium]
MRNKNINIRPFIKWAGGKGQILDKIRAKYPIELGKNITKYAEPFVGGGAVLFDVLSNFDLQEVYISDVNRELIATYINIRDNVSTLIEVLYGIENEYLQLSTDDRKAYYYNKRSQFNQLKANFDTSVMIAALFILLNHTCFNGLYRVNSKGEFNVPQGSYKNPTICDAKNLRAVSAVLNNVQIHNADYKASCEFIDNKTFAYFDPPYRPLTATSNFTSYASNGFGDKEQTELANFIDEIAAKGALFAVSNSDPKNTDEQDNFFDELYAKHDIFRITATRMISADGGGRRCVSELLIAKR